MAIWTECSKCKKSFSAQDDYLGKRVKCPSCGSRVEVLDSAARREADARDQEKADWMREQEEKIELLENISAKERRATMSLASEFGVSLEPVRNFNPGAVSRFRKLRALSRFMLLGAYLFLPLVLAGVVITIYLHREAEGSPAFLALLCLGWFMLLVFLFFTFKFLGEMAWLLADLGDHQLDARNLLIDIREDFTRGVVSGAPSRSRQTTT